MGRGPVATGEAKRNPWCPSIENVRRPERGAGFWSPAGLLAKWPRRDVIIALSWDGRDTITRAPPGRIGLVVGSLIGPRVPLRSTRGYPPAALRAVALPRSWRPWKSALRADHNGQYLGQALGQAK